MNAYANQIDVMLENEDKIKILRHDMKHHINEMKLMIEQQEFSALQTYISDMEQFLGNSNKIVLSGNREVDSILNYMLQKAKEMQLNTTVKVAIPEDMKHSFDLNIIIGNLLQNAIDAAVETEEKFLGVELSLKNGILVLEVENSFLPERIRNAISVLFKPVRPMRRFIRILHSFRSVIPMIRLKRWICRRACSPNIPAVRCFTSI